MTYQEAFTELQTIAKRLDEEELSLDQIEEILAKAEELSKVCQSALRRVGDKLDQFQQSQFSE